MTSRRKWWGWGYEHEELDARERERLAALIDAMFGMRPAEPAPLPPVEALALRAPRLPRPQGARFAWSDAPYDRVLHAAGRSYRDLVRLRRGQVDHPPDAVVYPASVEELVEVLEWADRTGAAVVPFGGGTSVTGGVEPDVPARFAGALSVDLTRMRRVLEIDPVSRLVHAEAGILGPDLDAALRPHGLTMRHYPQSYYFSTVGGWVATRSGGHYSTLLGKIDGRVAALEVVAANGQVGATRRLPSGSVGPDPNALWIGSEGLLGLITKVWLRAVAVPRHRATVPVAFERFEHALDAARAIVQSGLYPAHLRILDPFEAMLSATLSGAAGEAAPLMILGFEAAEHPVERRLEAALGIASAHGGRPRAPSARDSGDQDDAERWRGVFFRQPYLRDALVGWGVVADTFETAIGWDRAAAFYEAVRGATLDALLEQCSTGGVLCRTTHAYPDGVAFYFTIFGQGAPGRELEQWLAVKRAATDAVVNGGGTASHHHACGRDHAPWSERELPSLWKHALLGARAALDPRGAMNPGVIFPEPGGSAA